jgi:hypothetical protein
MVTFHLHSDHRLPEPEYKVNAGKPLFVRLASSIIYSFTLFINDVALKQEGWLVAQHFESVL